MELNGTIRFSRGGSMLNTRRLLAVVLALLIAFTSVLAAVPSAKAEAITTIEVYIGKNTGTINGKATTLEQGAVIKNGRTLVPLRFIVESMGATLAWDAVTLSLIHISEPTRLGMISYAVFCLKKKKTQRN